MRRTLLLAAIGFVLANPGWARTVDKIPPPKPVRLKIRSIVGLARSQAPLTFEIGLECDPGKFYEGRLELKWYVGRRLVHEFLSHDLTVTGGGQLMRVTLPPIVMYSDKTEVTAYGRLLTERGPVDLGEVPTDAPAMTRRTFVVLSAQPQELQAQSEHSLAEHLGLDKFNPQPDMHVDMLTFYARLSPEDMPFVAAGYAGYDMLVLEGEGFRRLKRGQLTAIATWAAAGGSLIVAPQGRLTAAHVEFLNRLSGRSIASETDADAATRPYALDERGMLMDDRATPEADVKLECIATGVGRAVIIRRALDPQVDFATPEWIRTVAFLWKLRAVQEASILQRGLWDFPVVPPRPPGAPSAFAPQRDDLVKSIRQLLLPERIEGIPLPVVVVLLSLFLLAVAPGDYFLLGHFQCRKYTWWLFAAISGLFTFCTVKIAESYMGSNDYRTALVFVDLDQGNRGDRGGGGDGGPARMARSSRFEMQFVATQRTVERVLRNCLYTDLSEGEVIHDRLQMESRSFGLTEEDERDRNARAAEDLPVFEGTMPGAFTIHQRLRQWSPRITRETNFGGDQSVLQETTIDWNGLAASGLNSAAGRRALFGRVLAREPEAQVLLLNRGWAYSPAHNEDPPGSIAADRTTMNVLPGRGGPMVDPVVNVPTSVQTCPAGQDASPVASLAVRASVRPASGLFAICSQISPTGGQILEDLSMLDESDPQQWLLLVVVRREHTSIVYRKQLYSAPTAGGG